MFSLSIVKIGVFILILIASVVLSKEAKKIPCEMWQSIPVITHSYGENGVIIPHRFDFRDDEMFQYIDPTVDDETIRVINNTNPLIHMRGCPCLRHSCIRKCCPKDQSYVRNNKTGGRVQCDQDVNGGSLFDYLEFYVTNPKMDEGVEKVTRTGDEILISHEIKNYCLNKRMFPLNPDEFYLLNNGSLLQKTGSDPPYSLKTIDDYCVDLLNGDIRFLMCAQKSSASLAEPSRIIPRKDNEARLWIYPVCMLTSLPFLTATCLLYCFIPDLNNLVGKSLSSLTFSRIIVTFPLTCIQVFAYKLDDRFCNIVAGFLLGFISWMVSGVFSRPNGKFHP